jgi:predicted permease
MQMARKVPTDRPDVLMAIRVSYVVVVLLQAAVYYIISLKIKKRNDTTVLKCEKSSLPTAYNILTLCIAGSSNLPSPSHRCVL